MQSLIDMINKSLNVPMNTFAFASYLKSEVVKQWTIT